MPSSAPRDDAASASSSSSFSAIINVIVSLLIAAVIAFVIIKFTIAAAPSSPLSSSSSQASPSSLPLLPQASPLSLSLLPLIDTTILPSSTTQQSQSSSLQLPECIFSNQHLHGGNNCLFDAVIASSGVVDSQGRRPNSQALRELCNVVLQQENLPTIPNGHPTGEQYLPILSKIFKRPICVMKNGAVVAEIRHEETATSPESPIRIHHAGPAMFGHWVAAAAARPPPSQKTIAAGPSSPTTATEAPPPFMGPPRPTITRQHFDFRRRFTATVPPQRPSLIKSPPN